ncbi:MAG: hypothetical protein JNM85_00995 [Chthonomonas sp.]|nr:hypothetical protein [Chthonomonas sp.]
MAKRLLAVVFLASAVGVGLYFSSAPRVQRHKQAESARAADASMRQSQAEAARLSEDRARLQSPAGREEAARTRGYLKPGEKRLDSR